MYLYIYAKLADSTAIRIHYTSYSSLASATVVRAHNQRAGTPKCLLILVQDVCCTSTVYSYHDSTYGGVVFLLPGCWWHEFGGD